jgi:pimeloyl-ACP methyl ester carboxylesterase
MMTEHSLSSNGLKVHYRMEGEGPGVLLIHGWVGSRRMWAPLSTPLAASGYRCWAVDLPGFGDSDKPHNGWYSIPNYTALLADFIQAVGLRSAHVVGHSMGGMIALDLAAHYPEQVERLVVINPVVTGQVALRGWAERFHPDMGRRLLDLSLRLSPRVLQPVLGHPLGDRLPQGVKHIRRRTEDFAKSTPDAILGSGRAVVSYDVSPHLPRITAPALVIIGDRDLSVSNHEGRLAAGRIPGARLEVMRGGHILTDERPAEVLPLVREFLA